MTISLVGCGSSDNSSAEADIANNETAIAVKGAGVKGPLINANVTAYQIDPSQADLKGDIVARGSSSTSANLELAIPESLASNGPFLIEYTDGTEINGQIPVIESLSTIITSQQLLAGTAVYATPLSSFAIEHARQIADSLESNADPLTVGLSGNNNGSVSIAELLAALETSATNIKATLGLGLLTEEINLFTTSPLINADTDAEDTLAIRTANEVFAAIVSVLKDEVADDGLTANGTTLVAALADDFADGSFDKQNAGNSIMALNTIDDIAAVLTQNPALLDVPNSDRNISQINEILAEEAETLAPELPVVSLDVPEIAAPLASLYSEENPKPTPPTIEPSTPTVIFTSATLQTAAIEGDNISVELIASDEDDNIAYCDLSIDGEFVRRDSVAPYQYGSNSGFNDNGLNAISAGSHSLTAECVDTTNLSASSIASIDIASRPDNGDGEPVLRNVALNWGTPTTRTDGSPLAINEIDHYEIYYSSTSEGSNNESTVSVAATNNNNQLVNDYEINALPIGEYYFSIATVDTAGIASEFINPVALTIQ
ncbi:MAG: hypothetical protein HOO01_03265 [Cellvibrionales bacterium]|nr:hypothetical protein [Cellvibrionales bacterium]